MGQIEPYKHNFECNLKNCIEKFGTTENSEMDWEILTPNNEGDWINQRNTAFDKNIPIIPQNKFDITAHSFFVTYSLGLNSNRDAWAYNSSIPKLAEIMTSTSNFYNEQVTRYQNNLKKSYDSDFNQIKDNNPKKIKWSSSLESTGSRGIKAIFDKTHIVVSSYRPFCKQNLYYDRMFNERVYQIPKLFPNPQLENLVICVSGIGVTKEFTSLITDAIPNLEIVGKSQCFPLYYYEETGIKREKNSSQTLLEIEAIEPPNKFIKRDGISDYILEKAKKQYRDPGITKEVIFYYVYGILHSPDYRKIFSNDLKKMLPKIPLVYNIADFWSFSKSGKKLADLHLKYETLSPYPDAKVTGTESKYFKVSKMKFPQKDQKNTIIYK